MTEQPETSAVDCINCDAPAELRHSSDGEVAWVRCVGCGAEGPLEYADLHAVARWNLGERRLSTQPAEAQGAGDWVLVPREAWAGIEDVVITLGDAESNARMWDILLAAAPKQGAGEVERIGLRNAIAAKLLGTVNAPEDEIFRVSSEIAALAAALQAPAGGEATGIPADIAEHVRKIGRVEWGQTPAHDAEGHGKHVADSVRMTAAHFEQVEDQHMHGLWLEGTETVLCHTGTSPNAQMTTRALVGAWNWLVDQSLSPAAQRADAEDVERALEWPSYWQSEGFNGAFAQAIKALRYLAENDRPIGGEQFPNAACCHQIADELETTRRVWRSALAAMPRASRQAGMEREEFAARVLWADGQRRLGQGQSDLPRTRTDFRDRARSLFDHPALASIQPAQEGREG